MGMRESSGMMDIFFLYLNVVEVTQDSSEYCVVLYSIILKGRERQRFCLDLSVLSLRTDLPE